MSASTLMETSAEADSGKSKLLEMTAQIVSAYLGHNPAQLTDVPNVITQVHATLSGLSTGTGTALKAQEPAERPTPAVPIKKSIHDDYLICLEDGKKLKMLKRHLKTSYDMTPEQYRERWGLPPDYPMVCPNYSTHRSGLAKKIGLGTRSRERARRAAA